MVAKRRQSFFVKAILVKPLYLHIVERMAVTMATAIALYIIYSTFYSKFLLSYELRILSKNCKRTF